MVYMVSWPKLEVTIVVRDVVLESMVMMKDGEDIVVSV